MFYVKYNSDPINYQPSKKDLALSKKSWTRGISYLQKPNLKRVTHGFRKCILAYCLQYGINYGKFLNQNFVSKNHRLYLKFHDTKFKCTDFKHRPWICDRSNSSQILDALYKQLSNVKNLSDRDILDRYPYSRYITIAHSNIKPSKKKQNYASKQLKHTDEVGLNEDPSLYALPFCPNVRKGLKALWSPYDDHYYNFSGIYKGKVTAPDTSRSAYAMLIQNISRNRKLLTSHCWIFNPNDQSKLATSGLTLGQHFSFTARVYMYVKHAPSDPSCDFGLDEISNIHLRPINTDESLSKLTDNQLGSLIGNLFDHDQLIYLLTNKKHANNRSLSTLKQKLLIYEHKINTLKSQYNKLNQENEHVDAKINQINQIKKSRRNRKTKDLDKDKRLSIAKQTKVNLNHTEKAKFKLLGSVSLLKAIYGLWNHRKLYDMASKHKQSPSHILGVSRKLLIFLKMTHSRIHNAHKYLANNSISYNDVIRLADSYQNFALQALHAFYHNKNHITIRKIESSNQLTHGSLLKLRKNPLAKHLYKIKYHKELDQSTKN